MLNKVNEKPVENAKFLQEPTRSDKITRRFALTFPILLTLLLALDSKLMADHFFDGRIFATVVCPTWALCLFYYADPKLRRVILAMIPLSYLGEMISSPWLELYFYRGHNIPFYIPFGHAVVFGSCAMISRLPKIIELNPLFTRLFKPVLISSILTVGLFFDDHLSLFFGLLLVIILQLKGWDPFYLLMAVIVFSIEIVGTAFQCWTWQPESPYLFRTINPPIGAVYIYVVGDIVVQWCAKLQIKPLIKTPKTAR